MHHSPYKMLTPPPPLPPSTNIITQKNEFNTTSQNFNPHTSPGMKIIKPKNKCTTHVDFLLKMVIFYPPYPSPTDLST